MKKALARIAASGFAFLLVACEKQQTDERIYFVSGSTGGKVDIFVNGNPTNGGKALTLFLADGKNTIELKGDVPENGYDLRVLRGLSIFDAEAQMIAEKRQEASGKTDNGTIEFDAAISGRWAWESADVLGTLSSEDQAAIYTIYDNICAEMKSDGFEPTALLGRGDVVLWSGSQEHASNFQRQLKEIGTKIPPRSELVFQSTTHDKLRLLAGRQIVMLTCDQGKLVYLGPPQGTDPPESGEIKWTFFYGFSEMFFIRVDGSWKLLVPNL
ncbi:MAG: hypothetical protein J0M04_15370 [Verrucomicrobia bacterium]|nr:hypothetical protein [Verrucomicrobiota bacterium]